MIQRGTSTGRQLTIADSSVRAAAVRTTIAPLMLIMALACSPKERAPSAAECPAPRAPSSADHIVTGRMPPAPGTVVVVTLEPRDAVQFPAPAATAVMDQSARQFAPQVLLVRTGQPVEFRNSDDEMHNVNIKEEASKTQAFNVGLPAGGTYQYRFDRGGFYTVTCDVHPEMTAAIVATSTPHVTFAASDGTFTFTQVAAGSYTLTATGGGHHLQRAVDVREKQTTIDLLK